MDRPPSAADRFAEADTGVEVPRGRHEWRDPRDVVPPEDRARYYRQHEPLSEDELAALEAENVKRYGVAYGWDDLPDELDDPPSVSADSDTPHSSDSDRRPGDVLAGAGDAPGTAGAADGSDKRADTGGGSGTDSGLRTGDAEGSGGPAGSTEDLESGDPRSDPRSEPTRLEGSEVTGEELGPPAGRDAMERPERADRRHDMVDPRIVGDYYPTIPPTVEERYLVRDQAYPVPLFDGPPTREQTAQGRIGDCGIVATLGAVAGHRPAAIQNAIAQTGDGRYEVRLHQVDPATPVDPVARPTGDTVTYAMNDKLPVATDQQTRPPAGMQADTCGWPALMEKAVAGQDQTWDAKQQAEWKQNWATYKPFVDAERRDEGLPPSPPDPPTGYNRLDIGSTPYQRANLLAELTGEPAEVRTMPNEHQGEQALLDEFRDRLAANKPILVGTRPKQGIEWFPNNVFPTHAYEVTRVENDLIYLRNPWGRNDPAPLDAKAFWEYFRAYNLDGSRTGRYSTLE